MTQDRFGNLMDWSRVLQLLEELHYKQLLDEHQAGLARIVRWGGNFRLSQWVLLHLESIHQASDLLIAELVHLLTDGDAALNLRVAAARGLGHLLPRRPAQGVDGSAYDPERVVQVMRDLQHRPGPPVLHVAIREALVAAGQARR